MNDNLPQTEGINPQTQGLDVLETLPLVQLLVREQGQATECVLEEAAAIAAIVEVIAQRLRDGGRLHYVGAGTSGRLGILDASECPPTFGTAPEIVCAHIAGGVPAITRAVEGAEDDAAAGAAEMRGHIGARDVVIGLSASGGTAFVAGALAAARAAGAWTVAVTHDGRGDLAQRADRALVLQTGPEPLAGSTRLRAGTAQKVLLNAISTATMVRLGKVYDNLMVDLVATNSKLRRRAVRLVMRLTDLNQRRATDLLDEASGRVKVAVIMERTAQSAREAQARLDAAGGSLRASLS